MDFLSRKFTLLTFCSLFCSSNATQFAVTTLYKYWPFPDLIDMIYLRFGYLQSIFAFRLNGAPESAFEHHAFHLAKISGLLLEETVVLTTDGFHLSLQHAVDASNEKKRIKGAVLLQHALMQSSDSFLLGGSTSLASALVHAGYDVYLGNSRGMFACTRALWPCAISNKYSIYDGAFRK